MRRLVLLAALAACVPPPPTTPPGDDGGDVQGDDDAGAQHDAGSLGRDDAGPFVPDDGGFIFVDAGNACDGLDETACDSSSTCRAVRGVPEVDHCSQRAVTPQYAGCIPADTACVEVETCATRFHGGDTLCFPDGCIPPGFRVTSTCDVPAMCPTGGTDTDVGQFCVRGAAGSTGEDLVAGAPVRVDVRPEGCFSSSCTTTYDAACAITNADGGIVVDALLCIGFDAPDGVCTADCSGGGTPRCESAPLAAGDYTATLGPLSVSFTVPSTIQFGGVCDGDPFQ